MYVSRPDLVPLQLGVIGIGGLIAWRASASINGSWGSTTAKAAGVLIFVGAVCNVGNIGPGHWMALAGRVAVTSLYAAMALWAAFGRGRSRRGRLLPPIAFAGLHAMLVVAWLKAVPPYIDVHVALTEGVRTFLSGHNPYAMNYPNMYTEQATLQFYGPGFMVDGQIPFGLPYPPINMILSIPAFLLGDVRYAGVMWLMVLAVALFGRGTNRPDRILAVLVLTAPGAMWILWGAWTESTVVPLLGLALLALRREKYLTAAILVGVLLVSKQYFLSVAPCLWLLRPYVTRGRILACLTAASLVTVPWLLADPRAFVRAIVIYQLTPPLRTDALSLLVEIVGHLGGGDSVIYRILPLALGTGVAVLFSWRRAPNASNFAVGVALSLLTTILWSKQAFQNYYFLAGMALLLAVWASVPLIDRRRSAQDVETRTETPPPLADEGSARGLLVRSSAGASPLTSPVPPGPGRAP